MWFSLEDDLTRNELFVILGFYAPKINTVSFAIPGETYKTYQCDEIIKTLHKMGGKVKYVSEWPGTKLFFGKVAQIIEVPFTKEVQGLIEERAPSLFSWLLPDYPEDLCLYGDNGIPLFFSTTHENYAELNLSKLDLKIWEDDKYLSQILSKLVLKGEDE